jgi:hypothetical protein
MPLDPSNFPPELHAIVATPGYKSYPALHIQMGGETL